MPLLAVVDAADGGGRFSDSLDEIENFDWVAFTSTNAVDVFVEQFTGLWPEHPRIAAVGPATAKRLRDAGYVVHFVSAGGTAGDLGESLPITRGPITSGPITSGPNSEVRTRVLAPLGDRASSALQESLEARGAVVRRVEAYRTLATSPARSVIDSAVGADYVFLTSPAIAKRFSELVGTGPAAVCIGPTTASAAERLGLTVVATATKRGPLGLIDALVNTIS